MTIIEWGVNYPNVLGRMSVPPATIRQGPIADKAMALIRGETPIHLAQKVRAQVTGRMNAQIPILDRARPYIDQLKARLPGLLRPQEQTGRTGVPFSNIPRPFPRPYSWAVSKDIGFIPSVIADIRGASGPERTLRGSKPNISVMV